MINLLHDFYMQPPFTKGIILIIIAIVFYFIAKMSYADSNNEYILKQNNLDNVYHISEWAGNIIFGVMFFLIAATIAAFLGVF